MAGKQVESHETESTQSGFGLLNQNKELKDAKTLSGAVDHVISLRRFFIREAKNAYALIWKYQFQQLQGLQRVLQWKELFKCEASFFATQVARLYLSVSLCTLLTIIMSQTIQNVWSAEKDFDMRARPLILPRKHIQNNVQTTLAQDESELTCTVWQKEAKDKHMEKKTGQKQVSTVSSNS